MRWSQVLVPLLVVRSAAAAPDDLSARFQKAAALIAPSVVGIQVTGGDGGDEEDEGDEPGPALPMDDDGGGTGVVIDAAGHILTNHHVIAGASALRVRLHDGTVARARL